MDTIKLWLDDLLDDPESPERHTPAGWTGAKTALEACRLIKTGAVTHVSFDHDLGPAWAGSGYTVARFIEKLAFEGSIPQLTWDIHSANPVGAHNIRQAMLSADKFFIKNKQ